MKTPLAVLLAAFLVTVSVSAQTLTAADEPVYNPGNGVSLPRLIKTVYVNYSARAMREKRRGTITLTCVVSSDGTTRDVKLVSGLEPQMDTDAVEALKQWKFEPGQRDAAPVAVRITVAFAFTTK